MAEMRAKFRLDLVGNVSRTAGAMRRDFRRMGDAGERDMARIKRSAERLGASVGMVAGRVAGIAAGFVGVQEIRRVMNLEERIERIGNAAERTTEEMQAMRSKVNEVAKMDDINIDPTQIWDALDAVQTMTGDIDIGADSLRQIALALQASGAAGKDVGNMVAALADQMDIKTPEGLLKALDTIAQLGAAGSFELQNFATRGSELLARYATLGRKGQDAVSEVGAMMNMIASTTGGNADTAVTAFDNLVRKILDPKTADTLRKGGIHLREVTGEYRSIVDIAKEIVTKAVEIEDAGGRSAASTIASVLGDAEAAAALNPFINDLKSNGDFSKVDGLLAIQGDGSKITENSARIAKTANAEITGALTELRDVTEGAMAEPIQQLAAALREVDRETVDNWIDIAKYVGATVLAVKGFQFAKGTFGVLTSAARVGSNVVSRVAGPALAGSRLANVAGSTAGPVPVFVTNMGFGSGGGFGGGGGSGGGARPFRRSEVDAGSIASTASEAVANLQEVRSDFNRKVGALQAASKDPEMRKHLPDLSAAVRDAGSRLAEAQTSTQAFGIPTAKDMEPSPLLDFLEYLGPIAMTTAMIYNRMKSGFDEDNKAITERMAETGETRTEAFVAVKEQQALETNEAFEATIVGKGILSARDYIRSFMGLGAIDARGNPMRDAVTAAAAPAVASAAGGAGAAVGGPDPIAPPTRGGGAGGEVLPASEPVDTSVMEDLLDEQVGETRALRETMDRLTSRLTSRPAPMMSRPAAGRVELLP